MGLAPVLRSNDPAYQPDAPDDDRPLYAPLRYHAEFHESAVRAMRDIERVSDVRSRPLGPLEHQVIVGPLGADWHGRWCDTVPVDPLYDSECNAAPHLPDADPVAEDQEHERRSMQMLAWVVMFAIVFVVCAIAVSAWLTHGITR